MDRSHPQERSSRSTFLMKLAPKPKMVKTASVVPFAPERLSITKQNTTPDLVEKLNKLTTVSNGRSEGVTPIMAALYFRRAIQRSRAVQKNRKRDETQAMLERHAKVLDRYKIRRVDVDESQDSMWSQRLGLFMINPHGIPYRFWQLITLCIIVYQTLMLPYSLAFTSNESSSFDLITNAIFAFDIVIQFNTPIATDDEGNDFIVNRCQIARNYATGWLVFDVLACIPFDMVYMWISNSDSNSRSNLSMLGLLKALRIPRLLRLFRLLRLVKLLRIRPEVRRWLQYSRYANLLRLLRLVFSFVLIEHYLACIWAGLVVSDETMGMYLHSPARFQYLIALYTTVSLIMGQNIALTTQGEYFFAILVLLCGAMLMAIVFGNVAMLIANFYEAQSKYQRKMEWLFASMNRMKLPNDLQNRINDYYQTMWEKHGTLDGAVASFIPELSRNLAYEVELFLRMDMINRAPIFQNCSAKVVQELVMELELQVYMPGDYVVVRGEVGNDMYFVQSGICEVTKDLIESPKSMASDIRVESVSAGNMINKEIVLKTLGQGDYFGEIALLMNCKRTANVRAYVFSELCALTRETFESISIRYLEDRNIIEKFIMDKYDPSMLKVAMKQAAELSSIRTIGGVGAGEDPSGADDTATSKSHFIEVLKGIDDRLVRIEDRMRARIKASQQSQTQSQTISSPQAPDAVQSSSNHDDAVAKPSSLSVNGSSARSPRSSGLKSITLALESTLETKTSPHKLTVRSAFGEDTRDNREGLLHILHSTSPIKPTTSHSPVRGFESSTPILQFSTQIATAKMELRSPEGKASNSLSQQLLPKLQPPNQQQALDFLSTKSLDELADTFARQELTASQERLRMWEVS